MPATRFSRICFAIKRKQGHTPSVVWPCFRGVKRFWPLPAVRIAAYQPQCADDAKDGQHEQQYHAGGDTKGIHTFLLARTSWLPRGLAGKIRKRRPGGLGSRWRFRWQVSNQTRSISTTTDLYTLTPSKRFGYALNLPNFVLIRNYLTTESSSFG